MGPIVVEKHVLSLDADFLQRNLPAYGFSVKFSSSPYSETASEYRDQPGLDGEELMLIGQRT